MLHAGPILLGAPPSQQNVTALAEQLAQTLSRQGSPTRATATAPVSAGFQPPSVPATDSVPAFAGNFVTQSPSSSSPSGSSKSSSNTLPSPSTAG